MLPLLALKPPAIEAGKHKAGGELIVSDGSRPQISELDPKDAEHVQVAAVVAYTGDYGGVFNGMWRDQSQAALQMAGCVRFTRRINASDVKRIADLLAPIIMYPELMWMFVDLELFLASFQANGTAHHKMYDLTPQQVQVRVIPLGYCKFRASFVFKNVPEYFDAAAGDAMKGYLDGHMVNILSDVSSNQHQTTARLADALLIFNRAMSVADNALRSACRPYGRLREAGATMYYGSQSQNPSQADCAQWARTLDGGAVIFRAVYKGTSESNNDFATRVNEQQFSYVSATIDPSAAEDLLEEECCIVGLVMHPSAQCIHVASFLGGANISNLLCYPAECEIIIGPQCSLSRIADTETTIATKTSAASRLIQFSTEFRNNANKQEELMDGLLECAYRYNLLTFFHVSADERQDDSDMYCFRSNEAHPSGTHTKEEAVVVVYVMSVEMRGRRGAQ